MNEHCLLQGTWPIHAHGERFYGIVEADGQRSRVAALVCHEGNIVFVSLVGYDTSVSATLASLWNGNSIRFTQGRDVIWHGPHMLTRHPLVQYKQGEIRLEGTKEKQFVALPLTAHIADGILNPPDMQQASKRSQPPIPRFLFGNWDEEYPHERSFLGTLYGLRVLFLHRHAEHPEWSHIWASELWKRGLVRKLVSPLPRALGIKAWLISGDLHAWGTMIGDGCRERWLPC